MCNRFSVKHPERLQLWAREWLEWEFNEFIQRYNVAPTDRVKIGKRRDAKFEGDEMQWGVKNHNGELRTLARADKVYSLHAKRLQERRCAVLADGFYEWQRAGEKQSSPFHFQLKGEQPFCLAGIYSSSGGFLILTTEPNALVSHVHHRMPIILDGSATQRWLKEGSLNKDELSGFAIPFPAEQMDAFEVSRYVGNSRNQGPRCLEPPEKGELTAEKETGGQLSLF